MIRQPPRSTLVPDTTLFRSEPLDDLEQVASVGLLKAIDRFDVARDVKFATFAVPTIAGELKRHFRDRGWMLRVPRRSEEHTSELQSRQYLGCRLLLEKQTRL